MMKINKMSKFYLFIFGLFFISYVDCIVKTTKVKDKINEERTGTLLSVNENNKDCFILFVTKCEIDFEGSVFSSSNFTATDGKCQVNATEEVDGKKEVVSGVSNIKFDIPLDHGDLSSVSVNIEVILNYRTEFWSINNVTVSDKKQELWLVGDYLHAPSNYSYSCGNLDLFKSINTQKDESKESIVNKFRRISFKDFQIQPFEGETFNESHDCASWFTIGTFAGLLVLILFTSILAFGILYIMNIRTNDRFEDPKGKPLVIGNTDG